jgi:simple sugar transport system ATP-binding protein
MRATSHSMSTLRAENLSKTFGLTRANDGIDLELNGGEIHALLGQNGAGKSTLVGILTGRLMPDEGRVVVDGAELELGSTRSSAAAGIATVFQELALVATMTGLENIALALRVSASRGLRKRVEAIQREYGLPAPLDVLVADLHLPDRQRLELVRALCQQPKVLLLDEPTSLLSPLAVEGFLAKLRQLAESGLTVLLITHRLDEARSVAERLTVLRFGKKIATWDRANLPSNEELAVEMLGVRPVDEIDVPTAAEEVILVTRDLSAVDNHGHPALNEVSLTLRRREILGVAGADGNGQLELLETIAGIRRSREGSVHWRGEDVTATGYERLFRRGVQLVSGDRQLHGIVPSFTIAEHFEYALGPDVTTRVPELVRAYGIRPPIPSGRADQLSGGNQQKMIVAAACERDVELLLLSYPTRGLDVQASLQLREMLVERAKRGASIVVSSSELDELLSVSHRIVVMNRGRIVAEQRRGEFDLSELARSFSLSPGSGGRVGRAA